MDIRPFKSGTTVEGVVAYDLQGVGSMYFSERGTARKGVLFYFVHSVLKKHLAYMGVARECSVADFLNRCGEPHRA